MGKLIVGIIILFILAGIYVALPLWAKLVVLVINSFFPDPIPVLDEVLMFSATIRDIIRIYKGMKIAEWIRMHKILSICIGIGIVIFISVSVSLLLGLINNYSH